MAKQITDLREQLRQYKFNNNVLQKIDCSIEENKEFMKLIKSKQPLPDGIFAYKYNNFDNGQPTGFYRIHKPDLTENEIAEYLTYKQLDLLKTIKGYLTFFVGLTVIGIIGALILLSINF